MAVIWRMKKGYNKYVTSTGSTPSGEEIELAREYDKELQKKIKEITNSLRKKDFFDEKNKMKKWYTLGKELQFLDKMLLGIKCDPDLKHTFRIFYDLAPHLAPTKNIPTDKGRFEGDRNYFYMAYQLAKFPWEQIKDIPWGNWTDIHAALDAIRWKDRERLLPWILKNSEDASNREKLRKKALKALRAIVGQTAKIERDTTVLSKEELYNLLNQKLNSIK